MKVPNKINKNRTDSHMDLPGTIYVVGITHPAGGTILPRREAEEGLE